MRYRQTLLLSALLLLLGLVRATSNQTTSPAGKVVTIGKPDHTIVTGDVIVHDPATVTGLGFSLDGNTLLVARERPDPKAGDEAGPIEVWNLSPLQRKQTLGPPRGWVEHAALAPNGKLFACLAGHGLQLWDWQAGRKTSEIGLDDFRSDIGTLEEPGECFQVEDTFAFLPDSSILYTGMKHKRLMRLDTATGQIQATEVKFPQDSHVAIAADGKQIGVSMYEEMGFPNGFVFYDVKTSALIRTLPFDRDKAFTQIFFPDGKRLLTIEGGDEEARNKAVEIATGKVLYSIPACVNNAPAAFSPNGELLATGGNDMVYLWNANSGKKVAELPSRSKVTAFAFSSDGRKLAVGFRDSTIKIWTLP
jgi:WD40 repeat protein